MMEFKETRFPIGSPSAFYFLALRMRVDLEERIALIRSWNESNPDKTPFDRRWELAAIRLANNVLIVAGVHADTQANREKASAAMTALTNHMETR